MLNAHNSYIENVIKINYAELVMSITALFLKTFVCVVKGSGPHSLGQTVTVCESYT